jgi:hypothetical protein
MTFGNDLLEPDLQPRLQELLIPLKVMLNGDQSMSETLCHFIHHQQDTLFSRRRESPAGRVLAAMIELHAEEKPLSSGNIAEKISEMDDEAEVNAKKIGWLTRKLGFSKERASGAGHRIVCWDESRVTRLVSLYGLTLQPSISPEKNVKTSQTSQLATDNRDVFPTHPENVTETSQAEPLSERDVSDNSDVFSTDKETIEEKDPWDDFLEEIENECHEA